MRDFLTLFTNVTFIIFIVGSIFYGISIGVNVYVKSVIKRIKNSTNQRFNAIKNETAKISCLSSIKEAQNQYLNYLEEKNKRQKAIRTNKILSLFSKKRITVYEEQSSIKAKDVFINLAKTMADPFSNYENKERGYLSFSEREIFAVLEEFRLRLVSIINSSNVIWLKSLKISFLLECYNVYDGAIKIKNRPFLLLVTTLLDFFLWFGKVISPVGMSKYIVSSALGSSLSSLLSSSIIDIAGKELAVIYYEKSIAKEKQLTKISA